ncbi:IucA/IucC family C-terminal-domain containing protein [Paenibacillus sp. SGZ-1009]|uniref:IucA/IucC family C-terminal-domain containing protein n=1 Tax=Paenibacillus campi TaxID=3106031 RepID=UPI002AFECE4C|nr:IucA/IucC family C-terminal-domain containing protein [Paenibacillus sp. SGZ-1009]
MKDIYDPPAVPPVGWTKEQWHILTTQLRLTAVASDDPRHSVSVSQLLEEDGALHYLQRLQDIYESDDLPLIASMLAKRYSYMIVAPALYAMTVWDKGVQFDPQHCTLESQFTGDIWLPHVRLDKPEAMELHWERATNEAEHGHSACSAEFRHRRERYVATIFGGHLQPVWSSLSRAAGVSRAILWENAAIYVYYVYETVLADPMYDGRRAQIAADFTYLTAEAPAALFGEKWNPLARFNTPKRLTPASEQPKRIRQTCCLYYLSGADAGYCSVCPKRET